MKSFFKPSSSRNQYFAAFTVNLISISHGCALGWLSPYIDYLQSEKSHLVTGPVTSENLSWIGSLVAFGGFFGVIIFGKISQRFGQKISLLLLVIPHYIFWLMVFKSTHVYHLYIARIFAGLTGGGTLRTISLYVTEISENHIRGKLGSLLMLFLTFGILVAFIAGQYLTFFEFPLVMMIIPTLFLIGVLFLPNSPVSLLSINKIEEARKSFFFYRNQNRMPEPNVSDEFEMLMKTFENKAHEKLELSDFTSKTASKGLFIGLFLMFLNQFSGTLAIMTYTSRIFSNSGSQLSSNESSTVVAVVQLFGVYISTICVDRFGRKVLMIISCGGSALFLTILASFLYLKEAGLNVNHFKWVPATSLSLSVFVASIGIISLPFVLMTELLPNKIRGLASTFCLLGITSLSFIILKIFPPMINIFQLYGCIWIFAGVCLFGAVFTIVFIPETKGKNLFTSPEEKAHCTESLLLNNK